MHVNESCVTNITLSAQPGDGLESSVPCEPFTNSARFTESGPVSWSVTTSTGYAWLRSQVGCLSSCVEGAGVIHRATGRAMTQMQSKRLSGLSRTVSSPTRVSYSNIEHRRLK